MMKKIHLKNFRLSFNRRNRPQNEENETRDNGDSDQQREGGNSENMAESERGSKPAQKQTVKGTNTTEITVTKRKEKQGFFKSLRRKLTTNLHSHKQEKKRESDSTISSDEDSAELRKQKQRAIAKSKHQRGAKAAVRPVERKVHTAHSDETSGSAEDSMELHPTRPVRDDLHSSSGGMPSRSQSSSCNCPCPATGTAVAGNTSSSSAAANVSAPVTKPPVETGETAPLDPTLNADNPPDTNQTTQPQQQQQQTGQAESENRTGTDIVPDTPHQEPQQPAHTSPIPLPFHVHNVTLGNDGDTYDQVSFFPPRYENFADQPQMWSLTKELFKLSRYGWYWGPITRVEAEEKLSNQSDGAFLVRDSSDERYLLSLSFRSYGRTLHTRIEHCNGMFSFYAQPESEGYTSIVDLIEHSMNDSQTGVFCYSRARTPGSPSFPVRLTRPVSRFTQVRSLQYLCRFVIRQYTRFDHIQELPLPKRIKGWLEENQY